MNVPFRSSFHLLLFCLFDFILHRFELHADRLLSLHAVSFVVVIVFFFKLHLSLSQSVQPSFIEVFCNCATSDNFFHLDSLVILAHFECSSIFLGDNNQYASIYRFNIHTPMNKLLKQIHKEKLCGNFHAHGKFKSSYFPKFSYIDLNNLSVNNQHF